MGSRMLNETDLSDQPVAVQRERSTDRDAGTSPEQVQHRASRRSHRHGAAPPPGGALITNASVLSPNGLPTAHDVSQEEAAHMAEHPRQGAAFNAAAQYHHGQDGPLSATPDVASEQDSASAITPMSASHAAALRAHAQQEGMHSQQQQLSRSRAVQPAPVSAFSSRPLLRDHQQDAVTTHEHLHSDTLQGRRVTHDDAASLGMTHGQLRQTGSSGSRGVIGVGSGADSDVRQLGAEAGQEWRGDEGPDDLAQYLSSSPQPQVNQVVMLVHHGKLYLVGLY